MTQGSVPINSCTKQIVPLKNPAILADLHLSDQKPKTMEAFLRFMRDKAPSFAELVILGDLFEFWAGDDHADAYNDALRALAGYTLSGGSLFVMHGNRDFLIGTGFVHRTNAVLIADPIRVQVCHERALLAHGDEWCTLDADYQQFRATLRNPEIQASILKEPLQHRLDLANALRSQSRSDNAVKDLEKMDVVISDVTRAAKAHDCHLVIHGHTHRPGHMTHYVDDYRLDRWVLPDWDFDGDKPRGGYLTFAGGYLHFEEV
jgi:UDP-2,3-diacylglucosamine hydrolase